MTRNVHEPQFKQKRPLSSLIMVSGFSLYARHVIDRRDRHRLERLRHHILSLEPVAQFFHEAFLPPQF